MMISLEGRKVLLIGGAGFIGHNLALELKLRGVEVSIVDGLQVNNLLSIYCSSYSGQESELYQHILTERINLLRDARIPLFVEDARDYHRLNQLISKIEPQVVVLLAAVSHASRSNKDPYSTFDHSFRTLENALDSSKNIAEHFIYFSSSMVYGNFEGDSVSEATVCNPLGIYGALKYGGEKLVIAYNQVFGLNYTIIRPSALYGERCISRRVGQIFIENALRGNDIIIRGDGTDALDFTYIGDLVQGVCRSIQIPEARNEVFNLTYGRARTLNEMATIVQDNFPHVQIHYMERDALMPERGTLSIDKARKLLGYSPQFPLEKGYPRYISWYNRLFRDLKPEVVHSEVQINE